MRVIAEDEIWCDFFYAELTTGLRRGEICGLKWEDFDEVAGTLNVYAHVTDDMQRQAAAKIDRGIGKAEAPTERPQAEANRIMTDFKPKRSKHRYWGSGYLGQTKGGRWNGRCTVAWPDGTNTLGTFTPTRRKSAKSYWRQ